MKVEKKRLKLKIGEFYNLKDRMRAAGIDARHSTLANEGCNITPEHFSRVVVGNETPSRALAKKLVAYFNDKMELELTVEDLFEEIIVYANK